MPSAAADPRPWDHFVLGLNYWPRRKGMYWWKHFAAAEVAEELEQVRLLNFEAIRIFLLWEDFQPERYRMDVKRMNDLEKVLQIADDFKLRCALTLFTGFMGGCHWLPHWTLDLADGEAGPFPVVSNESLVRRSIKPLFDDDNLVAAQVLQAQTLADAFAQHPAVLFWDLGKDWTNVDQPPSEERAAEWAERLAEAIKGPHGDALVTCELQAADLEADHRLNPFTLAESMDFLTVHGSPLDVDWAKEPLDADVPPFLNMVVESMSGKPVLFSELGAPSAPAGQPGRPRLPAEQEVAGYLEAALDKLWNAGSLGAFVSSYANADAALSAAPPFSLRPAEAAYGLLRADGTPKPAADIVRQFGAERHESRPLTAEGRFSGMDSYYRELPDSLTERYAEFRL